MKLVMHIMKLVIHIMNLVIEPHILKYSTLPETNIVPETLGLEDEIPFGARPPARCELFVSVIKYFLQGLNATML